MDIPTDFDRYIFNKIRRKRTGYTSGYNKKANIRMSDKIAVSIQVIVCFYQLSVRKGAAGMP